MTLAPPPMPPSDAPAAESAGATLRLVIADALVVILTFIVMFLGVGQLSAEAGLSAVQTAVMTLLTVAAPAQAAAMQIMTSDGATSGVWVAAMVAVIIVNLRFMVMVASILGRLPQAGFLRGTAAVGLVSASSFAIILPRLMSAPPARPLLYCALVGVSCSISAVIGALLGHQLAASVPALVGAALGAMIPIYFATLIARQGKHKALIANALAGAVLVPLAAPLLGSLSLLIVPLGISALSLMIGKGTPANG
ncbi:hypothetical protein Rru_A3297 [Rhodospirillum rubrum ATCC 11170]|uniref:AzlC-like n=2 Tax=Rhodospirillum rubrum TaxID=1085 RepID=Q2RP53_RHORT|nr:hypothetical protein Rru_A3297 [Rhodospirillum rubrum ATCC 11170]MBK5955777.1 hypothetical protein [Rhodospirillum rubrum]HCF17691.1 hypothetical protein [Rhodospirillum rubrum]